MNKRLFSRLMIFIAVPLSLVNLAAQKDNSNSKIVFDSKIVYSEYSAHGIAKNHIINADGINRTQLASTGKNNSDPDELRMKIWDIANKDVIYDNQMRADNDEDSITELGGGSIVIHEGSKLKSESITPRENNRKSLTIIEIYPNPFSNTAYIEFQHDESVDMIISVYDLAGTLIENLHKGRIKECVRYRFEFNPEGLASGTFIVKFIMNNESVITKQLILSK